MKFVLALLALLTINLIETNAQYFTIKPQDATLSSPTPKLQLTGASTPTLKGRRVTISSSISSPSTIIFGESLLKLIGTGYKSPLFWDQAQISMDASESWVTGGRGTDIKFFTTENGTSTMTQKMRLSDKGFLGLGLGNDVPGVPLHINYSNNANSFSSGALILGKFNSTHLNLDNNQIEAWAGAAGAPLYLNFYSQGTVRIGNGANGAGLDVSGYTRLGDNAPKIKMKELPIQRTPPSDDYGLQRPPSVIFPHSIGDANKILAVNISIENNSGFHIPPSYGNTSENSYTFRYDDTNILVQIKSQDSDKILDKPVRVLVTYKE